MFQFLLGAARNVGGNSDEFKCHNSVFGQKTVWYVAVMLSTYGESMVDLAGMFAARSHDTHVVLSMRGESIVDPAGIFASH